MKVYLLQDYYDYRGVMLLDIFPSLEIANEALDKLINEQRTSFGFSIQEVNNKPHFKNVVKAFECGIRDLFIQEWELNNG